MTDEARRRFKSIFVIGEHTPEHTWGKEWQTEMFHFTKVVVNDLKEKYFSDDAGFIQYWTEKKVLAPVVFLRSSYLPTTSAASSITANNPVETALKDSLGTTLPNSASSASQVLTTVTTITKTATLMESQVTAISDVSKSLKLSKTSTYYNEVFSNYSPLDDGKGN